MKEAAVSDLCLFVLSFVMMVSAWVLSYNKRTPFGPTPGKRVNIVTLLVCIYVSALLFNLGAYTNAGELGWHNTATLLLSSLRILHGGGTVIELSNSGLPDVAFDLLVAYEQLLYLLAPVSTLSAIAELLLESNNAILMRYRSAKRDTYFFTPLNNRTLALAKDIQRKYKTPAHNRSKKVCLVFTDVKTDKPTALSDNARDMGALVLQQPVETALKKLLRTLNGRRVFAYRTVVDAARRRVAHHGAELYCPVSVVFDNDDEASNVFGAMELKRLVDQANKHVPLTIFAIAQSQNAYTMTLSQDDATTSNDVQNPHAAAIRCVDWTRNLVERTLNKYPLFLTSACPPLPSDSEKNAQAMCERYVSWQQSMLRSPRRHVLIVGAGHVGTEFLRLALANSRIFGMSFAIDVFDNTPDPADPQTCLAKRRIMARMPELLDRHVLDEEPSMGLSVEFHLCDVLGNDYLQFLRDHSKTISYVFVCLNTDDLTTQVALRTREVLERACVARVASASGANGHANASMDMARPLIVGVVDNDRYTGTLQAHNGQSSIEVVGSPSHMYTYDCVIVDKEHQPHKGDIGYEQQQERASSLHGKYRVFALARLLQRSKRNDMSTWLIRWDADFDEVRRLGEECPTLSAIRRYMSYCRKTPMLAQDAQDDLFRSHEWLMRMEHARWNMHTRAEGYCRASLDELQACFDRNRQRMTQSGGDAGGAVPHLYRADGPLLHPYLVPLDQVAAVDARVAELYANAELPAPEPYLDKTERRLLT